MIVIDASAMITALVEPDPPPSLLEAVSNDLAAPHLIDVEVMSGLRGLVLGKKLKPARAKQALDDFYDFTITRYEAQPLADRVWGLRDRFTSYDANYLALAEALGVQLVTRDAKLLGFGPHVVTHLP